MLLLPVLLLVLATLAVLLLRRRRKDRSPPSPWKLPFIGNLHQLKPPVHECLHRLSLLHGPIMQIHLGGTPVIIASSPAAAREITYTHDTSFASRPPSTAADRLFYHTRDIVFAPYGEHWRRMRKVVTVHLLSTKKVEGFRAVREQEVANMVESIAASSKSGPVDLTDAIGHLVNAMAVRVALGKSYTSVSNEQRKEIFETVKEVSTLIGMLHAEDIFPWIGRLLSYVTGMRSRFRRCSARADAFLDRTLMEHRMGQGCGDGEDKDFVDELLALQEGLDEHMVEDENLKAIILDMITAAIDTNFITLEWIMSELINHPGILKKLQDEVRQNANKTSADHPLYEDSLARLTYMDAVIKETLRMHPPAPLLPPRDCVSEAVVLGHTIPRGTMVIINMWSMARDPGIWGDPDVFRPERFVDSGIDFKGHDYMYLPMGSGRRMCPGITFAAYLIKMALASLVLHFDWEASREAGIDMDEATQLITMRRKNPLVAVAIPH